MKTSEPTSPLSPKEKADLERLKATINRALSDGWLSRQERDDIVEMARADKKISQEEMALLRMIQEKIWQGEIRIES